MAKCSDELISCRTCYAKFPVLQSVQLFRKVSNFEVVFEGLRPSFREEKTKKQTRTARKCLRNDNGFAIISVRNSTTNNNVLQNGPDNLVLTLGSLSTDVLNTGLSGTNGISMSAVGSAEIDFTIGACPQDTDGDGLFDLYELAENNGVYTLIHTDNDGIPNYLDIDDDGDGILSIYEDNQPSGDHNPTGALDTDGDANYLDVDDDNDGYATWETYEGGSGAVNTLASGDAYTVDTDNDDIPN